jgi:branched-chain amino acid transport system permease protein
MLIQQLINGLILGAIYSLIALGYTLVYGILLMINFAHSEVLMSGAFIGWWVVLALPALFVAGPVALTVVLMLSMVGAGLLNMSIERIAYRPVMKDGSRLIPLISAISMSIILQNSVFLWISTQSLQFPELIHVSTINLGLASLSSIQAVIIIAALILMLALRYFIEKTRLGKAMRACSDDMGAAELMGIDSHKIISLTFLIGGALGGAAGVLYGLNYGSIKYNMGFMPGIKAFTAAVLGGVGNIYGAVLGGMILGMLEVLAAGYVPNGSDWRDVIAFTVLIVVLLFRPSGILGEKIFHRV